MANEHFYTRSIPSSTYSRESDHEVNHTTANEPLDRNFQDRQPEQLMLSAAVRVNTRQRWLPSPHHSRLPQPTPRMPSEMAMVITTITAETYTVQQTIGSSAGLNANLVMETSRPPSEWSLN